MDILLSVIGILLTAFIALADIIRRRRIVRNRNRIILVGSMIAVFAAGGYLLSKRKV